MDGNPPKNNPPEILQPPVSRNRETELSKSVKTFSQAVR